MATTIEVRRAGVYEAIDYNDFSIEIPTSAITVAPSATLVTRARESIQANQDLRITIDGTVAFEGVTNSPGTVRETGAVELEVDHPAAALFSESVDIALTSPTTVDVLNAALTTATRGGDFTLDYSGTAVSLASDYRVEGRPVGQVFRDIMDRTSRVWWIDPAGTTIHVEPVGGRGTWQALDAQTDGVSVRSFDEGSVSTVRNDVTVTATEGEAVSATATDSTSINTYGRRSESINIGYAATAAEAQAYADELIIADPLSQAELVVPQSAGNIVQPLANYTIDLTDSTKDISATGLVIEKQTLRQGRITIKVGEGSGVSIENVSRGAKSRGDKSAAGTVFNTGNLADDAVDTPQLVNTAVIESKLADAAVATAKLENNAVINGKLDNLSVSETKIQDDSISTPKLVAEAVTASEIEADTITAAEIAAGTITALEIDADTITAGEIAAGTITALELAANSITANEIDTLDLDTTQLSILDDPDNPTNGIEFSIDNNFVTMKPNGDKNARLGTFTDNFDLIYTRFAEFSEGYTSFGTSQFRFDNVPGINVTPDGSGSSPTIIPTTDQNGLLGVPGNAWGTVRASRFIDDDTGNTIGSGSENVDGEAIEPSRITTRAAAGISAFDDGWAFFYPKGGRVDGDGIRIADGIDGSNTDQVSMYPRSSDTTGPAVGMCGKTGDPWVEVHSKNFITQTPDAVPSEQVDLAELCECDWFHPPAYVRDEQDKRVGREVDTPEGEEPKAATPAGEEGPNPGVEIGTMTNYLLETCKAQQEHIADLTTRLDDLEARLEALEDPNA